MRGNKKRLDIYSIKNNKVCSLRYSFTYLSIASYQRFIPSILDIFVLFVWII